MVVGPQSILFFNFMAMYSTIQRVRGEAWFVGNTNISDSYIEWYQIQWYGLVVSYISGVYNTSELSGVNFVGSQGESVLQRAEELISAGFLLIDQYGTNDLGWWKTWRDRVNEGKQLLVAITKWDMRLVGNDWNEFERKNKSTSWWLASSWFVTGENKFSVNDEY